MQTFLPYPDFAESAKVLDYRRLGKQRVEVLQLLKALIEGGAWSNHPAANMWKYRENSLVSYGIAICDEWAFRGYKDTCLNKIITFWDEYAEMSLPDWVGNPDFHAAHRSNLLRKDPVHYGQFGWTEANDLPYIWPV
jgi:hypothetical protein